MSYHGPSSPHPEPQGPHQPGSYGWSSQSGQPTPYPQYGGQSPYMAASQPGSLPLRPMTLGDYFSSMFATIRKSPGLFFGAALIFGSIAALLAAIGEFLILRSFGNAMLDPYADIDSMMVSGAGFGFIGAMILAQLVLLLGQTFNWGIYSTMIARGAIGMKTSLGQGFRLLRGQWGRLIGLIALLILAVILVWAAVVALLFLVYLVTFAGGEPESGPAIAALVFGVLLSIFIPLLVGLFFAIRLHLVIPAMVIEDIGIFAALRRSWGLTRGYFWRTLGIVVLFALILGIVSAVITSPLNFIAGFILTAAGTEAQLMGSMIVLNLLLTAIASLAGFIVTNMGVLISIFFYFDYRFRKEGLGLHFQQLAAQHASGSTTDRFDTSMEHRPGGDDDANDLIPGRHAAPAQPGPSGQYGQPGPFGPTGQPGPYGTSPYGNPPQQPPYPGQPGPSQGPQGPPSPPSPTGPAQ